MTRRIHENRYPRTPPRRELSDEAVLRQAAALGAYLAKPGNGGPEFWFAGKDLLPADRAAVLTALADLDQADIA